MRPVTNKDVHEEIARDTYNILRSLDIIIHEIVSISALYEGGMTAAQANAFARVVGPINALRSSVVDVAGRSGRIYLGLDENASQDDFRAAMQERSS